MLNERQKKILEMELLPTEYEELTTIQRRGIKAIEEFMCYLDEAFPDETFEFIGYNFAHEDRNEQLRAECSIGEITVYRQKQHGKWVYLDNYAVRREVIRFTEEYKEELNGVFGADNWKLKYSVDFPKEVFENGMEGRYWLHYLVLIRQGAVTDLEASVRFIADMYALKNNYITMDADFHLVEDEAFEIGEFRMKNYIKSVGFMIYEDRRIHIY